jgi:hypothetical protein
VSLFPGNLDILLVVMQSLIVKSGVVPTEWFIEVMKLMMTRAHTEGTELAMQTLIHLGMNRLFQLILFLFFYCCDSVFQL